MIGRLQGILVEKQPPDLLIDVGGVFYEVHAPMTSIYRFPDTGNEVVVHTHFAVSETSQQLYGFSDKQDRELFRTLIKVNGVGPKLGLAILSGMESSDIVRHVRDDNSAALVKVPGVGKKTAERLIIELRDRLKAWDVDETMSPEGSIQQNLGDDLTSAKSKTDIMSEAESALIALGYKPAQAMQLVSAAQKEHQAEKSEELIRLALRSMASS
ncbi:MAG: Holliday junction branch migration protein RuvA [Cellvibrionaceae bacterium]